MTVANDTIHALASAPGKAGVAVLRISGPHASDVLTKLSRRELPSPRHLALRSLFHPDDQNAQDKLDEALIAWMPGPASFTGEDCAEIHIHGGVAILSAVLSAIEATGFSRPALPGEFSRRAFENGRMDLTRAESIADLVDAETEGQRRQAFRQYDGEMKERLDDWRTQIIDAMASLEAAIDFPDEEDVPDGVDGRAYQITQNLRDDIETALKDSGRTMAIRDGFRIAILGEPNAGKSSLLNKVAGRDAAIVSDIAGTTRDIIEVRLDLDGYVVWLSDTASLRKTQDQIEAEGVKRALAKAADSDLRIIVVPVGAEHWSLELLEPEDLLVINKIDLGKAPARLLDDAAPHDLKIVQTSVRSDESLTELLASLSKIVSSRLSVMEAPVVTRDRHRHHLASAKDRLDTALDAMSNGVGPELVSEDLRLASRAIGAITGAVDVEDLLDRIFGEFCIGK